MLQPSLLLVSLNLKSLLLKTLTVQMQELGSGHLFPEDWLSKYWKVLCIRSRARALLRGDVICPS